MVQIGAEDRLIEAVCGVVPVVFELDDCHLLLDCFGYIYQKVLAAVGETVFRVLNPRPRSPSMADSSVKELETSSATSL